MFSKLNTAECYIVVLLLAAGRLKYLFNVYACCRQLIKHIEGDGVEGGLHLLLKNCQLSVCIITWLSSWGVYTKKKKLKGGILHFLATCRYSKLVYSKSDHYFEKFHKYLLCGLMMIFWSDISSDRERSQSDLFSYFAAWCEDGESSFRYFKFWTDIIFPINALSKCSTVLISCRVESQNRHWLLLPWLLDTMMEMVGHKNNSLYLKMEKNYRGSRQKTSSQAPSYASPKLSLTD